MRDNSLRRRFADDVHQEIKLTALEQLATGGPGALSVNAIGRELGVSGPALYRYFRGRDELLTALIVDAYDDLADVLAVAVRGRRTPRTRVGAFVTAYRRWATEEPSRYRLLFREPLPGYDPNADRLVVASQRAMDLLLDALDGVRSSGAPVDARALARWMRERGLDPGRRAEARVALDLWPRVHGLVSLEIEGVFASMGLDPAPLYAVDALLPTANS